MYGCVCVCLRQAGGIVYLVYEYLTRLWSISEFVRNEIFDLFVNVWLVLVLVAVTVFVVYAKPLGTLRHDYPFFCALNLLCDWGKFIRCASVRLFRFELYPHAHLTD